MVLFSKNLDVDVVWLMAQLRVKDDVAIVVGQFLRIQK